MGNSGRRTKVKKTKELQYISYCSAFAILKFEEETFSVLDRTKLQYTLTCEATRKSNSQQNKITKWFPASPEPTIEFGLPSLFCLFIYKLPKTIC